MPVGPERSFQGWSPTSWHASMHEIMDSKCTLKTFLADVFVKKNNRKRINNSQAKSVCKQVLYRGTTLRSILQKSDWRTSHECFYGNKDVTQDVSWHLSYNSKINGNIHFSSSLSFSWWWNKNPWSVSPHTLHTFLTLYLSTKFAVYVRQLFQHLCRTGGLSTC
jgi:hypothetical protein